MQEPQAPQGQQGGAADALVQTDEMLFKVVSAVGQAQVPDEVKQMFAQSLQAYRGGMEALMAAAGGGQQAPQEGGVVTPEQGGGQAVPMHPGGPR